MVPAPQQSPTKRRSGYLSWKTLYMTTRFNERGWFWPSLLKIIKRYWQGFFPHFLFFLSFLRNVLSSSFIMWACPRSPRPKSPMHRLVRFGFRLAIGSTTRTRLANVVKLFGKTTLIPNYIKVIWRNRSCELATQRLILTSSEQLLSTICGPDIVVSPAVGGTTPRSAARCSDRYATRRWLQPIR